MQITQKKFVTTIVISAIIFIIFLVAIKTTIQYGNIFFQKIQCENSICTDSLCLQWNDSLKRCGTATALENEWQVKRMKEQILINDSLQKHLLNIIKKEDSLFKSYSIYTTILIKQIQQLNTYTYPLKNLDTLNNIYIKLIKHDYDQMHQTKNNTSNEH